MDIFLYEKCGFFFYTVSAREDTYLRIKNHSVSA